MAADGRCRASDRTARPRRTVPRAAPHDPSLPARWRKRLAPKTSGRPLGRGYSASFPTGGSRASAQPMRGSTDTCGRQGGECPTCRMGRAAGPDDRGGQLCKRAGSTGSKFLDRGAEGDRRESSDACAGTLPCIPLGLPFQPTAFRSDIRDMAKAAFPLFWGVRRA
jgi:hypothetical protein